VKIKKICTGKMNTSSNAPRGNQSGEMMQWEHVMNLTCFFLLMCQVLSLLKPLFGRLTGNPLLGRMTGNPICLGLQGVQQTQIPCSVLEGLSSPAIQIKSSGKKKCHIPPKVRSQRPHQVKKTTEIHMIIIQGKQKD
jgi:hypothetical protein